MAQWLKMLFTMSHNPRAIPWTHIVEGEKLSSVLHMWAEVQVSSHIHAHTDEINVKKNKKTKKTQFLKKAKKGGLPWSYQEELEVIFLHNCQGLWTTAAKFGVTFLPLYTPLSRFGAVYPVPALLLSRHCPAFPPLLPIASLGLDIENSGNWLHPCFLSSHV